MIRVSEFTTKVAFVPLKRTAVALDRPEPVIVVDVPTVPDVGASSVITGGGGRTVNEEPLHPVPPGPSTETGPLLASGGTTAVICVSETATKLAFTPLKATSVASVNPEPVSATDAPTAADSGAIVGLLASMALSGWAQAKTGDAEGGAARIGEVISLWRSSGSELVVPYFYGLQAEALLDAGRHVEGLDVVATALEIADRNADLWFVPELHRLGGDLRRARGDAAAEVESSYGRALDSARGIGARLFELRAAVGLGRLWRDAGRSADARELVSGIYASFTEGLDLPDLADARGLIEMDATA